MAQETNQSPVPMLCATGCGFYGNPRTNGMCSVCHKEHLSRQNNGGMSSMGAMGGGGVSLGSAAEAASSRRRLEATLNAVAAAEAEAAAVAAAEDAAAEAAAATAEAVASEVLSSGVTSLSVTRQMSRLSLSAGDCGTSVRQEPPEPVVTQPTAGASPLGAVGGGGDGSELTELTELLKPRKNRCFMCRKKVGLTGFDCRCGNLFCGGHRYSDKHNCPYDYKAEAAAKIRKDNPVVVADKIQRI